jgi:hypothetical protein
VPSAATGGTFSAGNYSITYANGSLTVSPALLTITPNSISKLAGVALPATTTDFVSAGLKNGETIAQVKQSGLGISAAAPVGTGYGIVLSDASGGSFDPANYSITYTPFVAGVSGGSVTVTAPTVQFVTIPIIVQQIAPAVFGPSALNYIPVQLPVASLAGATGASASISATGASASISAAGVSAAGVSTAIGSAAAPAAIGTPVNAAAGPNLSAGGAPTASAVSAVGSDPSGSTGSPSASGTSAGTGTTTSGASQTASAQPGTSADSSANNAESSDSSSRTANAVTAIGQVRDLVGPTNIRVVNGGINTSR